jgi:hypothetical protein
VKNHKNGFIWVEDQFMCSEIINNFAKFLVYKCKKIIEVRVTGRRVISSANKHDQSLEHSRRSLM